MVDSSKQASSVTDRWAAMLCGLHCVPWESSGAAASGGGQMVAHWTPRRRATARRRLLLRVAEKRIRRVRQQHSSASDVAGHKRLADSRSVTLWPGPKTDVQAWLLLPLHCGEESHRILIAAGSNSKSRICRALQLKRSGYGSRCGKLPEDDD